MESDSGIDAASDAAGFGTGDATCVKVYISPFAFPLFNDCVHVDAMPLAIPLQLVILRSVFDV